MCVCVHTGSRSDVLLQHLLPAPLRRLQRDDTQGQDVFPPRDRPAGQTHQSQTQEMLWAPRVTVFIKTKSGSKDPSLCRFKKDGQFYKCHLCVCSSSRRALHPFLNREKLHALHQMFQRHASVSASTDPSLRSAFLHLWINLLLLLVFLQGEPNSLHRYWNGVRAGVWDVGPGGAGETISMFITAHDEQVCSESAEPPEGGQKASLFVWLWIARSRTTSLGTCRTGFGCDKDLSLNENVCTVH